MSACSCGIDLAFSTVRPLRHRPSPFPCTDSSQLGTYLPSPACQLSLISPGNESSETCRQDHGRSSRKDRPPLLEARMTFHLHRLTPLRRELCRPHCLAFPLYPPTTDIQQSDGTSALCSEADVITIQHK